MVREPIIVPPAQGRIYSMGRIQAVFKADCDETAGRYSVSEWWLEPRTRGPDVHAHAEDHVYYVLAGTLSVRLAEDWSEVRQGTCVVIPGGTPHSFENRGSVRSGFLSFNSPGGFEERMKDIAPALAAEDLRLQRTSGPSSTHCGHSLTRPTAHSGSIAGGLHRDDGTERLCKPP